MTTCHNQVRTLHDNILYGLGTNVAAFDEATEACIWRFRSLDKLTVLTKRQVDYLRKHEVYSAKEREKQPHACEKLYTQQRECGPRWI
jgi:hypothetical protein